MVVCSIPYCDWLFRTSTAIRMNEPDNNPRDGPGGFAQIPSVASAGCAAALDVIREDDTRLVEGNEEMLAHFESGSGVDPHSFVN